MSRKIDARNLNPAEKAVINDICELLAYNPNLSNSEICHRTDYDIATVSAARSYISDSDIVQMRDKLIDAGHEMFGFVPDFKPTAYKIKCKDGVVRTCVNEFFGIVECGGLCYRNYRYTIPHGVKEGKKGGCLDELVNPMD